MNNDINLPHQLDALQQRPTHSFKPLIWKVIFIALLIVNLGFISWLLVGFNFGRNINLGLLGFVPHLFLLFLIDFFTILFYIKTQHPQGTAKGICYVLLIPISYYQYSSCHILLIFGYFDSDQANAFRNFVRANLQ